MTVLTYPKFDFVIVGINEGKLKQLSPLDMQALVDAFKELTGVDPLADGVKPFQVMKARAYTTGVSG